MLGARRRPGHTRGVDRGDRRRWTIEEDHQFGKDQFGYDHFQARLHTPILRHLVLVMAALAVCAITCADTRTARPGTPTAAPSHHPPISG